MGFAASALLASALADKPRYRIAFSGDGSFMMNPQILIDGVEHGVKGMIVIFDNRRMAAITGLQIAQYGAASGPTTGSQWITCGWPVRWRRQRVHGGFTAESLKSRSRGHARPRPVGRPRAGLSRRQRARWLGAWGQWNVGNWCGDVQRAWIEQDL